jgi:glycine cleavage system H protein
LGIIEVKKYIILTDRMYTETDEWVKIENEKIAIVGITDYAQKKLRDIIGVELPEVNKEVIRGDAVALVESVKATADIYAPLSGRITKVNEKLKVAPEILNKDPYGEGWIFEMEIKDITEKEKLLTPEKYAEKIRNEG